MLSVQQRILNMIQCFRKEWRLYSDSERTTVCGIDSMLVALQLSVAEVNKKHHGDFNASLSEVVLSWNYFLPDKLGILQKNVEAPENYVDIKSVYTSFLKCCNMLDLIDIYKKWRALSMENESISAEQLLEFIAGKVDLSNDNDSNRMSPDNEELPLKLKKILYSYLSLLINSKNDLAFAFILNIPDRGLGRKAFTDLKHAAQKKQMSIFLMATSFIRTIELGGKGYAPSPDDPLRVHMKGLAQFIHFMDKLEEIIGEVPDPGLAGGLILSTIKMHLSKGRNSKDPFCQALEEVVQDLDLRIKNIKNFQHETMAPNITGISPARPKVHSINHGTAYCGRDTVKSLLILLDEAAAHQPPSNKAQLLFGEEFGFPSIIMLFRSPVQSTGCSPKPLRQRVRTAVYEKDLKLKQPLIRSQFACTYKDDQMTESKRKHFSSFQVPKFILPVPKRLAALFLQDELPVDSLHSNLKSAALGTCSGNLHQNGSKSKEIGKVSGEPKNRSAKRKQVDRTSENIIFTNDNEPLQHLHSKKPKTATNCQNSLDSNIKRERKCNKTLAKNKLITGQSKLTQFFRL
ncbi:LOW QUALITY PROTEIN: PCNA-interacting partner [Sceloporus undulatus]|uniref:LOW QUALITY PROTEIN: PCNA-interacting partner n=1 Tax=Sceloporus undulatus TaxID=8520 RepID=UPI001C4C26EB|nr:LOW QUALITY PROTEIN: PCNA-interacting partner [Sceloporus undulatus]